MAFVRKDLNSPEQSLNIGTTIGKKTLVTGEVGLEVEVEGNKFPKPPGLEGSHMPVALPGSTRWSYVHDGSLRGADNAEYVLTKPIDFSEVPAALDELYGMLNAFGSKIANSQRTSTHVHLNVQPFFLNRLTSLMALYITLEEVLTEWCGEHRVGNLFCLRAKDAPAIVSQIRRYIQSNMETPIKEHHRYAGMNGNSIQKLGSVEFRALRGVPEPEAIKQWVGILRRLYTLSENFPDPRDICGNFSGLGPMGFFEEMLGDQVPVVRAGISMTNDQIADSMYEGIRLAQDICYARDWSVFKGIELHPDPFDRDAKKLFKRRSGATTVPQGLAAAAASLGMGVMQDPFSVYSNQQIDTAILQSLYGNMTTAVPAEPEPEPEQDWTHPTHIDDYEIDY